MDTEGAVAGDVSTAWQFGSLTVVGDGLHLLCINDHFTVTGSLAAHQLYWSFICSSSLHFIARRHALSQLALFRVTLVSLTLFPGDYASYSVLNTSPRDKVSSQRFEED